jgi:hypothetical protein
MRLVSLVLLATAAFGQTYTASTFAGVWLPENVSGASVSLQIGGVAVDAAGNVFLSLPLYAAVMRLDATTGILTRVAGNATNGFSGDNGPAVALPDTRATARSTSVCRTVWHRDLPSPCA